jgi:2-C-methyl-D-erythritol 4-phosphate cytidylyltransferase
MHQYVIIVAGGKGQRFESEIPKQFMRLKGLPILMHSIKAFINFDNSLEIIIALPENHFETWNTLCRNHHFKIPHQKVIGGETRFHSVKNALDAIKINDGIVAVHDAVRPLVSNDTIKRCFDTARRKGSAVPVIPLYDSIRELKAPKSVPVDRNSFVLVQTPQVFKTKLLKEAYEQPYLSDFTDDAHVVEKTGAEIILVEGNRENIKITDKADLIIAEALLRI